MNTHMRLIESRQDTFLSPRGGFHTMLIYLVYTILGGLLLVGCRGKDRPTPTPTPNPSPEKKEMKLHLSHGGVILDGRLVNEWVANDEVQLWGIPKEGEKPVALVARRTAEGRWKMTSGSVEQEQLSKAKLVTLAHHLDGTYHPEKESYQPKMRENQEVGAFTLSYSYRDVLLHTVSGQSQSFYAMLYSPYKQVQVILKNSTYPQRLKGIEVEIEGGLIQATYEKGKWSGTSTPLKITYKDKKEAWKSEEADTLFFALPTHQEELKATLRYQDEGGETKEETQTVKVPQKGVVPLQLTFGEVQTENPPLAFTVPVDGKYWKEANQKAWNLLHSNYGGELTEERARGYYKWTNTRPLTDESMHTKVIYKDDVNLLAWVTEMEEEQVMETRDWGLIFGLETLEGTLVEVYPPLYFNEIGGYMPQINGGRDGHYANYCYVTVPAGTYRMVCFVKYHEDLVGTRDGANQKWYKLPLLDSRDYSETCLGGGIGKKYLNERIPWDKSPYNGTEILTVVDRVASRSVAPRWRMGMTFQSWDDFKANRPSYSHGIDGHPKRKIKKGTILQATLVNNSNNVLKGTLVAKCEYLPMFNPIGYWRFDVFTKYYQNYGGRDKYECAWSREVGRTPLTLAPNGETVAQVEVLRYDWKWEYKSWCGIECLGPDKFIHFYWVDENGKEEMMKRVDYIYMNNAQKDNFGDPIVNYGANYQKAWYMDLKWREYEVGYGPAENRNTPEANGFNFY